MLFPLPETLFPPIITYFPFPFIPPFPFSLFVQMLPLQRGILVTSLVVQWLRLHSFSAGGMDLSPGQGMKIPYAIWHGQKIKN